MEDTILDQVAIEKNQGKINKIIVITVMIIKKIIIIIIIIIIIEINKEKKIGK